jgi:hypothetical protein
MSDRERGQATPLLLVVLLLSALCAAGVVRVGVAAAERASAQADATALAAGLGDRPAAEVVADANEAVVVAYDVDGNEVQVVIERRGRQATARARWNLGSIP